MRNFFGLVCLVAVVIACQSTALAGGGGSKSDPTIAISNTATMPLAAIVDPSSDIMTKVQNGTITLDEFQKAGGVIVDPGKTSKAIKTKVGYHTVYALFILDDDPVDLGDSSSLKVYAGKSQAVKVSAAANSNPSVSAPVLTQK